MWYRPRRERTGPWLTPLVAASQPGATIRRGGSNSRKCGSHSPRRSNRSRPTVGPAPADLLGANSPAPASLRRRPSLGGKPGGQAKRSQPAGAMEPDRTSRARFRARGPIAGEQADGSIGVLVRMPTPGSGAFSRVVAIRETTSQPMRDVRGRRRKVRGEVAVKAVVKCGEVGLALQCTLLKVIAPHPPQRCALR